MSQNAQKLPPSLQLLSNKMQNWKKISNSKRPNTITTSKWATSMMTRTRKGKTLGPGKKLLPIKRVQVKSATHKFQVQPKFPRFWPEMIAAWLQFQILTKRMDSNRAIMRLSQIKKLIFQLKKIKMTWIFKRKMDKINKKSQNLPQPQRLYQS